MIDKINKLATNLYELKKIDFLNPNPHPVHMPDILFPIPTLI